MFRFHAFLVLSDMLQCSSIKMLVYYYDVHAWRWDVKFWLIGDKWCIDLEGKSVVGNLTTNQADIIQKYAILSLPYNASLVY